MEKAAEMTPQKVEQYVTERVESNPLLKVIYFKIVNAVTLQEVTQWSENCEKQGCIAVQAGAIRLIDNIRFV